MMEREGEDERYRVSMQDTVVLYDTLVYGIELPALVVSAINRKTEQYYISEEYKFRVERERESERKKIEAQGIHEFQTIVSQGISDSYLTWRGIEATLQLSQSTNSKVVIIGSGRDGLPVILGNANAAAQAPASSTAPTDKDTTPKERTTVGRPAPSTAKAPAAGSMTHCIRAGMIAGRASSRKCCGESGRPNATEHLVVLVVFFRLDLLLLLRDRPGPRRRAVALAHRYWRFRGPAARPGETNVAPCRPRQPAPLRSKPSARRQALSCQGRYLPPCCRSRPSPRWSAGGPTWDEPPRSGG